MFDITPNNAESYLRSRGCAGPGAVQIEPLSGGVSNIVLRVETGGERFILKQSRTQLRTRDAWFSDLERIYREQEVMEALVDVLPPLTVPRVLFVDRENFVFAMSHAPPSVVWKESLLAGQVDPAMGEKTGQVLGRMHAFSAQNAAQFEVFRDRKVFDQLRIDPFYRRVQERRPEVAAALQPLIDGMLTISEALCHGDYTPKNILVHDQGFMLVDYETAHFGDPAMDLGLFLAHLFLKAVRRPALQAEYFDLIGKFWRCYLHERCSGAGPSAEAPNSLKDLEGRGVAHWGACLLARIDGTSPVDYLPEEPKRGLVRQLARAILLDGIDQIGHVLEWSRQRLLSTPS